MRPLQAVFTPVLDKVVYLRPDTTDAQVHADTFGAAGQYHLPPSEMPTPETVLDLGANIGLTAAHYRALWPDAEIVAVELDADNAQLARRNARVPVWNFAIFDHFGVGYYDPTLPAEAFAVSLTDLPGYRRVMCRPLRKLILRTFPSPHIADFVKIDIEGAEWGIFARGDWAPHVRHLLVELHHATLSSEAMVRWAIELLARLGFDARHHPPHPQAVWAVRP